MKKSEIIITILALSAMIIGIGFIVFSNEEVKINVVIPKEAIKIELPEEEPEFRYYEIRECLDEIGEKCFKIPIICHISGNCSVDRVFYPDKITKEFICN